jgi:predicted methyltransferase
MEVTRSVYYRNLLSWFREFAKLRVKPAIIFDQTTATVKTVVNRIMLMIKNGDLVNKKIVFIGDDDFMSICSALTSLPKKIAVIDIDSRITTRIENILENLYTPFKVYQQDLREELPLSILKKYDTFFTDPSYTIECVELFTLRGFECLRENGKGYVCIPSEDYSVELTKSIIRNLNRLGVNILSMWKNFNRYIKSKNCNNIMPRRFKSSLIRVESAGVKKPCKHFTEKIYAYKSYKK